MSTVARLSIAEAMKEVYDAIYQAGVILQLGCPDLPGPAGSDCGFATLADFPTAGPRIMWAKIGGHGRRAGPGERLPLRPDGLAAAIQGPAVQAGHPRCSGLSEPK
jgi:hypothetical protein